MSLDHAILGFLTEEELSGYDLKTRCFDRRTAHCWSADLAQVYRTLDRLREKKFVTSSTRRGRGKPDRRVYSITDAGREELRRWQSRAATPPAVRDPYLLQLYFADGLTDDEVLSLLTEARSAYQERLEALRAAQKTSEPSGSPRAATVHRMTVTAAATQARAAVDWLDDCIDKVRTGLPKEGPL